MANNVVYGGHICGIDTVDQVTGAGSITLTLTQCRAIAGTFSGIAPTTDLNSRHGKHRRSIRSHRKTCTDRRGS
ncbi:hypothetical protein [Kitasatospora sp. NPDC050543]|uniref:hypothetical protein n=1 Tax=Kitasatospora sp. NPDC050543 TaxID=3364054 RepID=UPI0037A4ECBA